jgi:hypothetical protein
MDTLCEHDEEASFHRTFGDKHPTTEYGDPYFEEHDNSVHSDHSEHCEDSENTECDVEELRELLLSMQNTILRLEKENFELQKKIEFKDDMVHQLTANLMTATEESSHTHNDSVVKRRASDRFIAYKARWYYYRDHKNDPQHNGSNWRNIKRLLDKQYDAESDQVHQHYIHAVISDMRGT